MRKTTQRSVSNPPQIWKTRGPFTGSLKSFDALSPKYVHMNMASVQMEMVMAIIERIPIIPPPNGVINWLMIRMTNAHSLPLANCIAMPVLSPSLPSDFEVSIKVGSNRNMPKAMTAKNSIPIQWSAMSAVVFPFNESTRTPMNNSMIMRPVTIPAIRGTLLFFPNIPLCAKQVNAFGPGVNKATPIITNNWSRAVTTSIAAHSMVY